VKPVLFRALRDHDGLLAAQALDTIEAVNLLMGWNIAAASKQKAVEKRCQSKRKKLS
jgi:hypothetical protein